MVITVLINTPFAGEKRRQRLALLNQILSSTDGSKHSAAETCPSEDDGIGLWPVDPQPESAACSAFTNEPPEAVNDQLGGVPGNVLGAEPSMAILNTMPAQDWTSYLLGAPESDTHHCAASNTYGNIPIPSLAPGGTILNEGGSFGNWPEGA